MGRKARGARPLEVHKVGPRAVSAWPQAKRGVAAASPRALRAPLPGADTQHRVTGGSSVSNRWNLIPEAAGREGIVASFTQEEIEDQSGK